MVQFGKKLQNLQYKEWESYYLDYKVLKKVLKQVVDSNEPFVQEKFKVAMDLEIEKVVLFFLKQQGVVAGKVVAMRKRQKELLIAENRDNVSMDQLRKLTEGFRSVGGDVVHIVQYVELNAIGIRKILKKHDKNSKDHKITGSYIESRTEYDSHLKQLYHYEGIAAIVTSIRTALCEIRKFEDELIGIDDKRSMASPTTSRLLVYRRSSPNEFDPILSKISAARRRLHHSTQYVQAFAFHALIFDNASEEDDGDTAYETFGSRRTVSEASNALNLLSTFLYMTNYYIVAPTSGQYATKLGCSPALSGMIIGMTPVAALVSAVLYSWWANYSYKSALMFASTCSIAGNILYALALPFDSVALIILGRLLNGFGGARAINRRYIADSYPYDERTAASALFVTSGALGMAAGPAAAVLLTWINFDALHESLTIETAPGWLMTVLWIVYISCTYGYFQEPQTAKSKGLISQTRNSAISNIAKTSPEKLSLLPTTASSVGADTIAAKLGLIFSNTPVVLSLWIYFVLKLVLECLCSSSATITTWYFDWSMAQTGSYLAILGLIMFPANFVLGYLSFRYDDRELIFGSMVAMLFGILGIVSYGSMLGYSQPQYIISGIMVFIFSNLLEGVNMSLLSKTIPKSLAKGTFNSGLLATEAGTLGRAVGDNFLSLVGIMGLEYLLNYTFVPLAGITAITLIVVWNQYEHLEPRDEDEI